MPHKFLPTYPDLHHRLLEPHTMICEAIPDDYRFRSSRTNVPVIYHLDGKNYKITGAGGFGFTAELRFMLPRIRSALT